MHFWWFLYHFLRDFKINFGLTWLNTMAWNSSESTCAQLLRQLWTLPVGLLHFLISMGEKVRTTEKSHRHSAVLDHVACKTYGHSITATYLAILQLSRHMEPAMPIEHVPMEPSLPRLISPKSVKACVVCLAPTTETLFSFSSPLCLYIMYTPAYMHTAY